MTSSKENRSGIKRWMIILGVAACVIVGTAIGIALITYFRPLSAENVVGTYVASWPFGTDTITLNIDGTFVQQVEVNNEPRRGTIKGSWTLTDRYVRLDTYLAIADGFGKFNSKWRDPSKATLPIDTLFFITLMNSGAVHPYVRN